MRNPEANGLRGRLERELASLAANSQLRHLEILPDLNFSSNDYLGLSVDPRLREAVAAAMDAGSPVGSTGSRLLSGHAAAWEELESQLARFAGAEAALYFSSGYAANVGLFSSVPRSEDVVFSDSANHASIIDGIRLSGARKVIFPHLDLDALENELRQSHAGDGQRFIAVESVFSMDGDRAPLADLVALADRHGAELIVDEAHATGVFGPQGRGLASAEAEGRIFAVVHTCGKALAGMGAFVSGSKTLKQFLINRARTFIFSTALPPYVAAQMSAAVDIVSGADAARERLANLAGHLRARLQDAVFDAACSDSQIVPVLLGDNERALHFAARLCQEGFAVRAIRPPTVPAGSARLRLSLTARHSQERLDQLVDALIRIRDQEAAPPGTVTYARPRSVERIGDQPPGQKLPLEPPVVCRRTVCRGSRRHGTARRATKHRQKMTGDLFVTGTDTNVGKTVLAALLVAALDGTYWKPIQTGSSEGTDRQSVMRWAELPEERTLPECYCFEPPVSPHLAAAESGVTIELEPICKRPLAARGPLIAEGAGGVLVPINDSQTMLDLIRHLGLPVVIASRSALGTINHTLLTVAALRAANIEIRGVVMIGNTNRDNERAVERYGAVPIAGRIPVLETIDRSSLLRAYRSNFDARYFQ